jgi:hypothetical protein
VRVNIIYYITIRDDLSLLSTLSRVTEEDYYTSWTLEKRRKGEASPSSHVQDRSFPDAKAPGDEIPTGFCCCINSFSSPFQLVALSVSYIFSFYFFLFSCQGRWWPLLIDARSWWVCKTLIIIFRLLLDVFWISNICAYLNLLGRVAVDIYRWEIEAVDRRRAAIESDGKSMDVIDPNHILILKIRPPPAERDDRSRRPCSSSFKRLFIGFSYF